MPNTALCQVEAKKALARWVVSFSRALRIHFQPEVTIESELKNVLTPAELEMLAKSQHRPVRAIHAISQVRLRRVMPALDSLGHSAQPN